MSKTATDKFTVNINGEDHKVEPKTTILDLADDLGIKIPTLCHDPRLKPFGACRL